MSLRQLFHRMCFDEQPFREGGALHALVFSSKGPPPQHRRFFIHPSGRSSFAETAAGLPEEGSKDAPPNGPLASRPGTEEEFTLGHVFPAEKKKYIVTDPTKLSANGKFLYQDVDSGEFLEVPDGARVIVQVPKNGGEDVNDGGTDKTAADPAGSIYQTGDHEALGPASVLAQGPARGGAVSSLDAESGALPGVVPPNGPGAAVAPGGPEVPASHNPYAAPPTGAGGGGGMEVAANAKDPELVEAEDVEEGNGGNVAQGEAAPALPGQETAATGAQEDPGVGVAQEGAPAGAAGAAGSDGSATTGDQQGHNPEATSLLAIGQPTRFISGGRGKINVDEVPLTMNHIAAPGAFEVADDSFNRAKLAEIDAAVAVEIQNNDPTFSADAPSRGLGSKVVPMKHVVFLEVDHRGATPSSSRRAFGRSRRRRAPFTVFAEDSKKWVEITASPQVAQKVAEEALTKGKTRESGLAEANEQRRRSCEDGAPFVYMPLLNIPFGYSRRGFRDGHYFDINRKRGDGYGCPAPKPKQIVPAWVMNEVAQDFFVDPY